MTYRLLLAILVTSSTAFSQWIPGFDPGGADDPADVVSQNEPFCGTLSDESSGYMIPRYSRGGRTQVNASTLITGIGFGARTTVTKPTGMSIALQYTGGWMTVPFRARDGFETPDRWASFIPVMIGGRIDLANVRNRSFEWNTYVAFGAGPIMGLEISPSDNLFQTFSRMAFRWGAGAYAGVGSDIRLFEGWYAFAQLEWDYYGFLAPVGGRDSYSGPGFSFGIQSAIF